MDMQNVTDLHIPEGDVRTIHDKDSRLLWGRLSYDTKYSGNSYQNVYSGKNLFNKNGAHTHGYGDPIVTITDTGVRVTYNTTGDYPFDYWIIGPASDFAGKTLTLSSIITKSANGLRPTIAIGFCKQDGSSRTTKVYYTGGGDGTLRSIHYTVVEDPERPYVFISFYATNGGEYAQGDYSDYANVQLEIGSSPTSYEPYTGSTPTTTVPAPNPDYPQPISVATGTQTISITAGPQSEIFPINLGSTELCKVGNYQDYIYKNGNDWYIHQEIAKYTFTGTETWGTSPYGTNSWRLVNVILFPFDTNELQIISNIFTGIRHIDRNTAGSNAIYSANSHEFNIRNTSLTSLAEVQAATNGNYVYYALATPTDTQITDNTLIGQLNDVHGWLVRYGYNATVTGNLPIIINRTNL